MQSGFASWSKLFYSQNNERSGAMLNLIVTLFGFKDAMEWGVVGKIERALKDVNFGVEARVEVDGSRIVFSGDGKRTFENYIQLRTSKNSNPRANFLVLAVLKQFHQAEIFEDMVMVGEFNLILPTDVFKEGHWQEWSIFTGR
jgi:hypothetical protein